MTCGTVTRPSRVTVPDFNLPIMSREQIETTCRSLIAELAEVWHRTSLQ